MVNNINKSLDEVINKTRLSEVISDCYRTFGLHQTVLLLDKLKKVGFELATMAGISISVEEIRVPPQKEQLLKKAKLEVLDVENQYRNGLITDG